MLQLKRFKVENFRAYKALDIQPDVVNVMVGPNGAGKSTLVAALETLLLGRNEWTDAAGKGLSDQIRHGEKKSILEADLEGVGTVRRQIYASSTPDKLDVGDLDGSTTVLQQALLERIGAGRETLSAALHSHRFLEKTPAEQREMLFRLAGLTFNRDEILNQVKSEVSPEALELLAGMIEEDAEGGPELFGALHKEAYARRREANRAHKELRARVPEQTPSETEAAGRKAALEERLRELRQQQALVTKAEARVAHNDQRRRALENQVGDLSKKITDAENYIAGLGKPQNLKALAKKTKDAQAAVEAAKERAQELLVKRQELAARVETARETAEALAEFAGKCPLAPELLDCPVPAGDMTAVSDKAAGIVADLEEQLAKVAAEHAEALDAIEPLQKAASEAERARTGAETTERRREQYAAEAVHLAAQLEAAREELVQLQDEAAEAPRDTDDLAGQIEAAESDLRAAILAENQAQQAARLTQDLAAAEAEAQAYDELVKALAPDGVPAKILESVVGPLVAEASEWFAYLMGDGWELGFETEGDFDVIAWGPDDTRRPARYLSKGEQLRAGVALQIMFNSLTGLGLIVVDDAEALDPAGKGALVSALYQLAEQERISHAFILSALGDKQPVDPGWDGLSVWMLEAGDLVAVEPLGVAS